MDMWPDVYDDVICGDCYALIRIKKYRTCRTYCESVGLECLNAFEEDNGSCTVESIHNCDTDFDLEVETSDALCQCRNVTVPAGISIVDNRPPILINSKFAIY